MDQREATLQLLMISILFANDICMQYSAVSVKRASTRTYYAKNRYRSDFMCHNADMRK